MDSDQAAANPTPPNPVEGEAAPVEVNPIFPEETAEMRRGLWAEVLTLVVALIGAFSVSMERTWGWDESMHAELPALRMSLAVDAGQGDQAWDALLDCQQYPFVYPTVLAAVQSVTGPSELWARRTGRVLWALTALGVFRFVEALLRRATEAKGPRRGDGWAPWLAAGAFLLSPLAMDQSGTLFLEVPFACASAWCLWAWARRPSNETPGPKARRSELLLGAFFTVAFFTKFNYALLLGGGLGLARLFEIIDGHRRGRGRRVWARAGFALAPVALALAWWFLWPYPGDMERGRRHWQAFASFLGGNQDVQAVDGGTRLIHWAVGVFATPRMMGLAVLGVLVALVDLPRPRIPGLLAIALVMVIPVSMHPFHLDRFLIPLSIPLVALAALGWSRLLPSSLRPGVACLAVVVFAALISPSKDSAALLARLDKLPPSEPAAGYVRGVLAERSSLRPDQRLETAGLFAETQAEPVLDWIYAEVGEDSRVGWLGISSELSPCAVHAGLLARGGSPARFLRDAHPGMYVQLEGGEPGWDDARLLEFARGFDVLIVTNPPDIKGRPGRGFATDYALRLQELGWRRKALGNIELEVAMAPPRTVSFFALRPAN